MAASPRFKVYTPDGEYIAACKYSEDAAMLASLGYGKGATIRDGHTKRSIVWTEGVDGDGSESYDLVAAHITTKLSERSIPQ